MIEVERHDDFRVYVVEVFFHYNVCYRPAGGAGEDVDVAGVWCVAYREPAEDYDDYANYHRDGAEYLSGCYVLFEVDDGEQRYEQGVGASQQGGVCD